MDTPPTESTRSATIPFPASIDGFSESDVREEIIAPALRALGYATKSAEANIIREQRLTLRYPRAYLGRKKPGRDPELLGFADYILNICGLVQWTIEAKPSTAEIAIDDIEQAFTYANHPEVRAVMFSVCNGHELRI